MGNKLDFTAKDRYLLYKDNYFHELGEPNKILMRLPMLIAGLAILLNIYFRILENNKLEQLPENIKSSIILLICAFTITTIVFCVLTAKRRKYEILDLKEIEFTYIANEIPDYLKNLDEFNKKVPLYRQLSSSETEDEMVLDYLLKKLPNIIENNHKVNEERKKWFNFALYSIFLNIVFILIIIVSFKYDVFTTLMLPILIFMCAKYGIFNMSVTSEENIK